MTMFCRRIRSMAIVSLLLVFTQVVMPQSIQKFALVIGNGDYTGLGKLKNPVNDAKDMADILTYLGFTVDLLSDTSLPEMEEAVLRLGSRLSVSRQSVGFFFYAGHGVQSGGENYLIPADATIVGEAFLRTKALAVQPVLDTLQSTKNRLNVIVLDACRDNPFSWSRSGSRGLNVVGQQPPGSIIAYATSAGRVAQDGDGRNGVFTSAFLKNISTPGIDISEVFRRTGAEVLATTAGAQVPAIYNQFFGTFYLAGNAESPSVPKPDPGPEPESQPEVSAPFADRTTGIQYPVPPSQPKTYPQIRREEHKGPPGDATVISISLRQSFASPQRASISTWRWGDPISSRSPSGIYREPRYAGQEQRYGKISLGVVHNKPFLFVIDLVPGEHPVLYFDIDHDGDLSNDGPPITNEGTGVFAAMVRIPFEEIIEDPWFVGAYEMWLFANDQLWNDGQVGHIAKGFLSGMVKLGKREYAFAAGDTMTSFANDGDYTNDGVFIDINNDGRFDYKTEHIAPGTSAEIDGIQYAFIING